HIICKEGLLVDPTKVTVIIGLRKPTGQREVRRFLVHTGYYRKFIKGYAKVSTLLEELLKGKGTFYWGEQQQCTFDTLKKKLTTMLILHFPLWGKPFHVHVDASGKDIYVVLAQLGE
ncbi:hypothetical protein KI387_044652, partial [Taxus chinensis]